MVFDKWRARRASIHELKARKAAIHMEHRKMVLLDSKQQPPSYNKVSTDSGETVTSSEMGQDARRGSQPAWRKEEMRTTGSVA